MAHQEAVAGVGSGGGIVGLRAAAIHLAEDGDRAPVVDVIEQGGTPGLHRTQHQEFAGEHDPAASVAGRALQVDDAGVGGGVRVEGEMGDAADLLIGPGLAEALAGGEGDAFEHLDPVDGRPRGAAERQNRERQTSRKRRSAGHP